MVLAFVQGAWTLFLFFIFGVLPIAFVYGFVKGLKKEPEVVKKEEQPEEIVKEKKFKKHKEAEIPSPELYRTVKKEAGSYLVMGPDNTEAIVIKVTVPNEGNLWVAALAVKNGKHSERVKTKKKAVALAIELLKEYKENTNGS
jgi:hypothetical protein